MKKINLLIIIILAYSYGSFSQSNKVRPCSVSTAVNFSVSEKKQSLSNKAYSSLIKSGLNTKKEKSIDSNKDNHPLVLKRSKDAIDPVLQDFMGSSMAGKIKEKWEALSTNYKATDCNGAIGPNHYIQTVNLAYAIYDKQGNTVVNPTNLNDFFADVVPDGSEGQGDPVTVYDEQANRWIIAQFGSDFSSKNYIFFALSKTDDPTGAWYKWAFQFTAFPDYFKIGVREDGYYIGINPTYASTRESFVVLEREVMLKGGANPQMVAFERSEFPNIAKLPLPADTDGAFAPAGEPGLFLSLNDDAWGGSDQLWLWELKTDWQKPSNSSLEISQKINVAAFSSEFDSQNGDPSSRNCIIQKGSTTKLDAFSATLMFRVQYRNFGDKQTMLCYHTVNVESNDQAGLRWYELEKTTGAWTIRQQGTYAPDGNSRFLGSIAMNGRNEIALGYSFTGSDDFIGIRFTGQSATEYAKASGIFDVEETIITEGTLPKTSSQKWVDYTNMTIDPTDNHTFWYTNSFVKSTSINGSYIASFEFSELEFTPNFNADNTSPIVNSIVKFTDLSNGNPDTWLWKFSPNTVSFVGGTTENSQHPEVKFLKEGKYTVSLTASQAAETKEVTKNNYINISPTGISSIKNTNIKLYSNKKNIYVDNINEAQVLIFDVTGKELVNEAVKESPYLVEKSGVYIVIVRSKTNVFSGKVMVK